MTSRREIADEKVGVIAGRNPVLEALSRRSSEVEKVFFQKGVGGAAVREIGAAAARAGVPIQYVPRARMDQIAPNINHQGVAAVASHVPYVGIEQLLIDLGISFDTASRTHPFLLVLDRVQDPHNYGAILRSAAAAAVDGVVVPAANMSPVSAAVVKASAGTAGVVPIARVSKLGDAITQLKETGLWIVGLDATGGQSIWETRWNRPIAVVVGSEGAGMDRSVRNACDEVAFIPMPGQVESLNVSVAAAIMMFVAGHARAAQHNLQ